MHLPYASVASFSKIVASYSFLPKVTHCYFFSFSARAKRSSRMDDIEFDPHATRTIFIGNVEKTLMHGELKAIFQKFGDVVVRVILSP